MELIKQLRELEMVHLEGTWETDFAKPYLVCHKIAVIMGAVLQTKEARKNWFFPKCTKLMKINFVGHNCTQKCTVLWSNLCYRITFKMRWKT